MGEIVLGYLSLLPLTTDQMFKNIKYPIQQKSIFYYLYHLYDNIIYIKKDVSYYYSIKTRIYTYDDLPLKIALIIQNMIIYWTYFQ